MAGAKQPAGTGDDSRPMLVALSAAIFDLTPQLKRCIEAADPIVPDLQYSLATRLVGVAGVATLVEEVELKRIDVRSGAATVETPTKAEACFAELLTRLELPPSSVDGVAARVIRYDGCGTEYDLGRAQAQEYARAYPAWAAAHPRTQCPDRLEDLHPYMSLMALEDPWGAPYRLLCGQPHPGNRALEVHSAGKDGKDGTDDDVISWK